VITLNQETPGGDANRDLHGWVLREDGEILEVWTGDIDNVGGAQHWGLTTLDDLGHHAGGWTQNDEGRNAEWPYWIPALIHNQASRQREDHT